MNAVADLVGVLVQHVLYLQYVAAFMVAIAQAFPPMDTACSLAYVFVVPGLQGHQWLIKFCHPLFLVTLGDRL